MNFIKENKLSIFVFGIIIVYFSAYSANKLLESSAAKEPVEPMIFATTEAVVSDVTHIDIGIPGIEGWLFLSDGTEGFIYSTTDGKYVISGLIIDGEFNTNLTEEHLEEYVPSYQDYEPDPVKELPAKSSADKKLSALKAMPYKITQGRGDVELYVAVDLTCPFCTTYFNTLQDALDEYTIHWIPLALLSSNSLELASFTLNSKTPLHTMKEIFAGNRKITASDKDINNTVIRMTNKAKAAEITGVPLTVFETEFGVVELPGARTLSELRKLTTGR